MKWKHFLQEVDDVLAGVHSHNSKDLLVALENLRRKGWFCEPKQFSIPAAKSEVVDPQDSPVGQAPDKHSFCMMNKHHLDNS